MRNTDSIKGGTMPRKSSSLQPSCSDDHWKEQGWSDQPIDVGTPQRLDTVISVRLDPESTKLIRRAAALKRMTRSDFVRQASVAEAARVIELDTRARVHRLEWASQGNQTIGESPDDEPSESSTFSWYSLAAD
ncbi:MAG: DUF1778 domain-containing protein [Planctomycetaceae bacterium]|nr:DUF1778 domain-containing protein [Planctomycetaceae bacterium]